jgi:hypothetical protein
MRRPARLERAGALTPRDRIWAAIRDFGIGHVFSVAEIMLLSEQRADTVLPYLNSLAKGGYAEAANKRPTNRPRREFQWFSLVRDVGVDAPRIDANGKLVTQGCGRDQMWKAVRTIKGEFGARELALAASTEDHPVAYEESKIYARALANGGYLTVTRESKGGKHQERLFRFNKSRNTGPRAPIITRDKEVMDANNGTVVYTPRKAA